MINQLARDVLAAPPFPLLASRGETLEPITPTHPAYEAVGFKYYKQGRRAETLALIKQMERRRTAWAAVGSKAEA